MRLLHRAAALAFVAVLLPACSADGGKFQGFYKPFPDTIANGQLSGSQVIPALGSGAAGTATLTVDGLRKFIDYTINATGLTGTVTAIEVRNGTPGANGAVLFSIPIAPFPISGHLTDMDILMPQSGDAIAAGQAYLLISTSGFPTGEVRAHLGSASLASAALTGAQVPIGTAGRGSAAVSLTAAQDQFTVSLTVSGLVSITGAQIFDGKPGVNGSAPLFTVAPGAFTTSASATLGAGDFTASATITTFPDAINALLSGGLYVLVLTAAHPTGEIRGQIGPTPMSFLLSPADVAPPVVSAATGSCTIAFGAMQDKFLVLMTHTVVGANLIEIHTQLPTFNGPRIFNVAAFAGAATSPVNATIPSSALFPATGDAINTFADAVDAMLTGRTYIVVGSPGFPAGEIRGQIVP
jgi:hypothetical protein